MKLAIAAVIIFMLFSLLTTGLYTVEAQSYQTLIIKPDGSIEPNTTLLERNGSTYIFKDNIFGTIEIEKEFITIDGAGYTLQGERITSPTGTETYRTLTGINITKTNNITIANLKIITFKNGIYLQEASNCIITNNALTNAHINLQNSTNNYITNNTITHGDVELYSSYNNTFTSNMLYEGNFNTGSKYPNQKNLKEYINSIDSSNYVDDAPVYYLVNQSNLYIDSNITPTIGCLALINSNNVTIGNVTLIGNNYYFALIVNSSNSALINCRINTDSYADGIVLFNSTNNLLANNTITANLRYGITQNFAIYFDESANNNISKNTIMGSWWIGMNIGKFSNIVNGNKITGCETGISIGGYGSQVFGNEISNTVSATSKAVIANDGTGIYVGGYVQVFGNIIKNNGDGISVFGPNNIIYQNNFINNTKQVSIDDSAITIWDNGTVGNYWSDYQAKYPNAKEIDSLGIWNTPYSIDSNNTDLYPLTVLVDISKIQPIIAYITPSPYLTPTSSPTQQPTLSPSQTVNPTPIGEPIGIVFLIEVFAIIITLVIVIIAVGALIYRKLRNRDRLIERFL